ncbi:MAG: agmatine deiminase family protein [Crocinitomicaceae bacterium]|nr:agmatine deiminase family protein [Crocinitomicaceae bacterium]MBK8927190.1 agmatine deiminase family protein [Crocinitomicaceae bacterium]
MKNTFLILFSLAIMLNIARAQQENLPRYMTPEEYQIMDAYLQSFDERGITTPPPFTSLRTAAEWEEVQALVVTWTDQYNTIHRQIIDAAQEECLVIIMCTDSNDVKSNLTSNGVPDVNISYIEIGWNSVWIRDYGANSVYVNDVDSLILVDWIYNRPRPLDDVIPDAYAAMLGINIYSMTANPYKIVATGGNWMSDGAGQGFSSELILDENDGSGSGGLASYPTHTEPEINDLYNDWMGITSYIKMTVLPYDGIHHIDMHMKIVDEETLLVGEYPDGVADGPQIEANLQYVLSNFTTKFGTPYKVVRIPQPPSTSGLYPDGGGYYRTYANQTFVNNTILLPTYREEYDTIALNILDSLMPGYTIVPIDVDNTGMNLISAGGAIHCITHTVGVSDPLLISHKKLEDTYDDVNPYLASAEIKHKSGIVNASIFYKTTLAGAYTEIPMTNTGADTWTGSIPAQAVGTTVYYYIGAEAVNGRQTEHPIPAPDGYHQFKVLDGGNVDIASENPVVMNAIYPNPAKAITVIPVTFSQAVSAKIYLTNMLGELVAVIHDGNVSVGEQNFFIDASQFEAGIYQVVIAVDDYRTVQKLIIQ